MESCQQMAKQPHLHHTLPLFLHQTGKYLLAAAILLTSACATIEGPADPQDPFESFNRSMYNFNSSVDKHVMKPVAEGYTKVIPAPARTGVNNFFANLGDVSVIANDLLQLKPIQALSDLTRLVVNSTIGLYGLIDVATPMGLRKHNEDFGQTLGYWGIGDSPYLVLPFFGPSSIRDGVGLYTDNTRFSPIYTQDLDSRTENTLTVTKAISTRANLLSASRLLDTAALDEYIFLRDAYLQRRRYLVYDGDPPRETFNDNDYLDDEEPDQSPDLPIE